MNARKSFVSPWFFVLVGLLVLGLEHVSPGEAPVALIIGGVLFGVGLAGVIFRPGAAH
ncbi:hypothetical protein LWF15_15280 [Kineosporia rhizophila]|uniref:hypothetical protein n=1 Tax=Kineosporia TaxID=49184 RepID=UPI001E2F6FCD|nr:MULTISPECIES: hypothetical protein [Kineosporia]MCE0536866.1 hypothetical protein [Kineosporia rhizophila]GLY20176.1 hypothetical protein Kisp01_71900 [Kineosporia sp. NBRC 101677]